MSRRVLFFCIVLLALAAGYTLASAWITVERIGRLDAAGNAQAQSQQVLSALHAFATAAVDVESSSRGYALTGNEAYLQPFDAARREAPQRLDEMRDLLRDDPKQLARVERLTPLLAERIAISEHGISQKRNAPDEPFMLRFGSRGRETTDEMRRIVADMESDERHDLAARKSAWQQELQRARATEAVSAASSLAVIALSLWALMRLRRAEVDAAWTEPAASAPPPAAALPAPSDFAALVDETLRRAALIEASHPPGSAERSRVEALRSAIDGARAGFAPADGAIVLDRLGLPLALSALVTAVRTRERCAMRESIDAAAPPLAPAAALLLFRAAAWALDVLCRERAPAEIGVGLAHDGAHVVVRVESPLREFAPIGALDAAVAERLADEIAAAGGDWQWTSADTGRALVAMLPAGTRVPSPATPESLRA